MFEVSEEKILSLHSLLLKGGRTVIVTHEHPDGDAVGSTSAMWHFLKDRYGTQAVILYPDSVPEALSFLTDGVAALTADAPETSDAIKEADLIIALDFNDFKRSGRLQQALACSTAPKVLIDHHPDPEEGACTLIFSRCDISSASELLYQILLRMPGIGGDPSLLPMECAVSLMTGMTTDTNNFANSVFPSTLEMAAGLLAAGVDRDMIIERIYHSGREQKLRAWSYLLDNRLVIMECGVAYIILDSATRERFGLLDGETDGLVNSALQVGKVKVSALLTEEKDHFRISLRSKKPLAINGLARESFNGGGHPQAAGGRILMPAELGDRKDIGQYFENIAARFMMTIAADSIQELK